MAKYKKFKSKILLFGEYTVLEGGEALAIPFEHFQGGLATAKKVDKSFQRIFTHIRESLSPAHLKYFLENKFLEDIEQGVHFDSNIPVGYGVGSSGTLTAAIFSAYFDDADLTMPEKISILKTIEDLFHGKSSGVDPLVSILDRPIHVRSKSDYRVVTNDISSTLRHFYLFDSKQERSTAELVNKYNELKNSNNAFHKCNALADMVKLAISKVVNNLDILQSMSSISMLQKDIFLPMIPEGIVNLWEQGIQEDTYYFKLCGAGGGGYFLVYAPTGSIITDHLPEENLIPLLENYE